MSWRRVDPSPFRGWIGWAPRSWPAVERPRLDLAERRIVWPEAPLGASTLPEELPDEPEAVYLPAVPAATAGDRGELARRLVGAGCAPVAQDLAPLALAPEGLEWRWVDLFAELVEARMRVRRPRAGVAVGEAWGALLPLVPGLLTRAGELASLLDGVRAAGASAVLGLVPELTPADRRRLVDRLGEEAFEEVFHGAGPSEAELAREAARRGLAVLPPPPRIPGLTPRRARNRTLAAALAECGELALRLGRPEAEASALLAAARRLRSEPLDLAAVAREGNLEFVDWLPASARRLVAEELAHGESGLRAELRAAWLGASR